MASPRTHRRGATPSTRRYTQITTEFEAIRTEPRAGNIYGPPLGTNLVVFIDDMNMPKVDTYGVPSCRGAFTSLIRLVAIAR